MRLKLSEIFIVILHSFQLIACCNVQSEVQQFWYRVARSFSGSFQLTLPPPGFFDLAGVCLFVCLSICCQDYSKKDVDDF